MRGTALQARPTDEAGCAREDAGLAREVVATDAEHTESASARYRRWRTRRPSSGWVPARVARRVTRGAHDAGMATAEYAIATLAAVGFAGLLVVILKGNEVKGLLGGIIKQALSL